jgi:hypothetical protein
MSQPVKIVVVIPAYNEEASIAAVVGAVNSLSNEALQLTPVVVNDAYAGAIICSQ